MDLIKFATYLDQEIDNVKQTYITNLICNPEEKTAGYIQALIYVDELIRKMVKDLESGNFKSPEAITIKPLSDQFVVHQNIGFRGI